MSGPPPLVALSELPDILQNPFALEELGRSEVPVIAVDLDGDAPPGAYQDTGYMLRSVRAVTVAVASVPVPPLLSELASQFDILLTTPDLAGEAMVPSSDPLAALQGVADAVAANPLAAVAMAELLRQRAYTSVPEALVLESLTYSMLQSGPEFGAWLSMREPAEMPPDPEEPVLVDRVGTSLAITLNRPHRANAFSAAMRDRLVEVLRVAVADTTLDGVVLRGAGRNFSSGGDLAEFGTAPDPATAHATRLLRSPAWWMARVGANARVHLHGACIGAGIEVAAFAGTVLARPDTTIRLPEVSMGLVPGAGGTVSLPRRIGPHRTAYLAITGTELNATDALAWGLVDRLED